MTISEAYRAEQKRLHEDPNYGVASRTYAPIVAAVIKSRGIKEVLDYGAGKQRLKEALGDIGHDWTYRAFEPAFADPEPSHAEMVVCIDVLEHIEPEHLNAVLDELARLTKRVGLFTVHCGPARRVLSDGRNAHLTQKPPQWWLPKLWARFDVEMFAQCFGGFVVRVAPKKDRHDY